MGTLTHVIEEFPVDPQSIYELVVAGNSTMRDLFFRLDVHSIGQNPYQSITELDMAEGRRTTTSLAETAAKLHVPIHPRARVYGLPIISGHVGADAAACMLAVDIANEKRLVAVMDIGTNTELILGNRDKILAASCPAGPAFEGGKISCGMPGLPGAIEKVFIEADGSPRFKVIGDGPPEGICGSGLVDLLGQLLRTGRINPLGRFEHDEKQFTLTAKAGHPIAFTESDINELAQAKGANVAGLQILFQNYGAAFEDVDAFYLAGGFGRHLNIESSKRIGLIPNIPDSKIIQVGNASIEGACIALLSKTKRAELEQTGPPRHALPPRNASGLLRLFRRRLPVQPHRIADRHESCLTSHVFLHRNKAAAERARRRIPAAAGLSAGAPAVRSLARTRRLGAPLVCGKRAALDFRPQRQRADVLGDKIYLGGTEFSSDRLSAQFRAAKAHDAMLVAVSAGAECEAHAHECWQQGRPDEYFFLEMYGSAVVEFLVTHAAGRVCAWAEQNGMAVLPHYSPGYTGWPVSDQPKLWNIIRGDSGSPLPAELEVMESGMLRPKKSLLTVFGLTRHPEKVLPGSKLIPCENCSLPNCQYRRAPYRYFMPQLETINLPRRGRRSIRLLARAAGFPLDLNARYTVNARALRKWTQERLQLEIAGDGSVNARFRYEGTTCSNFGHPIQYDFSVRLHPPSQDFRVADVHCAPVAGDTGYALMCEYLKDPDAFTRLVAGEKPLLGRPLNDVLAWNRSPNPAACQCDAGSREHKWGLVFEVIHFALTQQHRAKLDGQASAPATNS